MPLAGKYNALHDDATPASAGIVRVLDGGRRGQRYPDMPWEPKAAFTALAEYYSRDHRLASH